MTDHEADEIVVQRKRRNKIPMVDKMLAVVGVTLAAFATFFPWYAFFNQDQFSVPSLWQGDTRDMPEVAARNVMSVSPQAMPDNDDKDVLAAIDQLTTATVPDLTASTPVEPPVGVTAEQPFPAGSGYRLMHVANGRALIEDDSGMYIVRVGSVLPDNSRLATLEERDGRWVMITSNGDVVPAQ